MQVSGTGIDSGKTKAITVSIVDYAITTSFDSIPTTIGWNQTSAIPFRFWINPDDFGKIWMSTQSLATISKIHVSVSARWLNGTHPAVPAGDITMLIATNGTLQTLGYYRIVLQAPPAFNANATADYSLEFNITAWYDRSGTVIPLYRNITVIRSVEITKVPSASLLGATDEGGSPASSVLQQVAVGANVTFYVQYIAGSNVTFSVQGATGSLLPSWKDISMIEVSPGLYKGTITGLAEGTYKVLVHADPGSSSNYNAADLDLSLSVAPSIPWLFMIILAGLAVAVALAMSKVVSHFKVPRLVRVIDSTIEQLGKTKSIQNVAVVRSLEDILDDETKDAWAAIGLESPYRSKANKAAPATSAPKKATGEKNADYKEVK